jgi:hypothetical protein
MKRRSVIQRDLFSPKYRKRIMVLKTAYKRRPKHKKETNEKQS